MFLLHKENLGIRAKLRKTIQNFIKNLIFEAGHKLLCDVVPYADYFSRGMDFATLFRIFLKSYLFYDNSQAWLRND